MLFGGFQGFRLLLDLGGVFDGWSDFSDWSGLLGCSCGSFCFALAATHFPWVVRSAAVRQDACGRFNGRCRLLDSQSRSWFDHLWLDFDHRSRLLAHLSRSLEGCRLDFRRFGSRRFDDRGLVGRRFDSRGFGDWRFNHWRFDGRRLFDSLRYHFDDRLGARLDHGNWLADRLLDHWRDGHLFSSRDRFGWRGLLGDGLSGFGNRGYDGRFGFVYLGSGAFGLLMGLGLGVGADVAGRNSSGHGQASGQVCTQVGSLGLLGTCVGAFAIAFGFAAFDQFAVGVTLTLAAVAAATLATGATTWALALGAFRLIVLQQFFVRQLLVASFLSLFGDARLTLFTWRTRLALFAGGAFFTWGTFLARNALFTWRTFFAGYAFFARRTFLARRTLFARCRGGRGGIQRFA